MKISKPSFKLASLAVLTMLAACGGGGSDSGSTAVSSTNGSTDATLADTTAGTSTAAGANAAVETTRPDAVENSMPDNKPLLGGTSPNAQTVSGTGITALPPIEPNVEYKEKGWWSPMLDWPVLAIHAALTTDGRVLTFGTEYNIKNTNQFGYDVWDPTLGTGDASHLLLENQTDTFLFCSAQILLTDGRLMVLGGDLLKNGRITNTGDDDVNLFDPKSNLMTKSAQGMSLPRWYATATMLPNGDVYVQGGTSGEEYPEVRSADGTTSRALKGINTKAEYTSANGAKGAIFENNYPRNFVAPNGKIFGFDPHFMYEVDPTGNGTVKMFKSHWDIPHSDPVKAAANPGFYRGWSATSATAMVRPGVIMQFGGSEPAVTLIDINGAEPKLTDVEPMNNKVFHWSNATIMADGNVLVSGGSTKNLLVDMEEPINEDAGEINYDTWIFNPDTRTWKDGAKTGVPRLYHSLTLLLPDATILSSGGGAPGPVNNLNAQIYRPPYLFNADGTLATRPVLEGSDGALPLVVEPTTKFTVNSPNAADIEKVTLIKTGAITHSFDMDQRYSQLEFTATATGLEIQLPANKYQTPPGYYHVFAINKAGVPSKSRMIKINPTN